MTTPYKKRAKGNWNQGKSHKGDSEERQYAKVEVIEQLKAKDDTYLTPHRKKRRKNDKARLEYRISWYQQAIEKYQGKADSYVSSLREGLRAAQKEYKEKFEKS